MTTASLNIRTDKAVKEQAETIFNDLGLNMTTAINIFLRSSIRARGIPFELKLNDELKLDNEPKLDDSNDFNSLNATTATAIEQGKKLMGDPTAPRYSSIEDLKTALEV